MPRGVGVDVRPVAFNYQVRRVDWLLDGAPTPCVPPPAPVLKAPEPLASGQFRVCG